MAIDEPPENIPSSPAPAAEYAFGGAEVRRFFIATWKNSAGCEICEQKNTWNIPVDAALFVGISSFGKHEVGSTFTAKMYSFMPVFCSYCGNSKFIQAKHIENWLREHPEEAPNLESSV